MQAGVLSVAVLFGDGLKDGDFLGKSDPYVKVFLGTQTMRTKTIKGGGKKPVWNETLRFNLVDQNTLTFEVYDEDLFKDDLLGVATADLAEVRKVLRIHATLPVLSKKSKKQHGTITVDLELAPNGVPASAPAASAPPLPLSPQPAPNKAPAYTPAAPGGPAPGYPVAGAAVVGAAAASAHSYLAAPPPQSYPGAQAAQSASASYSGPPPGYSGPPPGYPGPAGYPGTPPPGYPSAGLYSNGPPPGYPGALPPGYPSVPPPGYPSAPPPGYPGAPYGYPPGPYGAPLLPAGYAYPGSLPGSTVYQQQPQRHQSGMGAGAGMAMGALGGLAAGLLIADIADGDLFDSGF